METRPASGGRLLATMAQDLPTLQQQRKWTAEHPNLQPGELVLILEDGPRGLWPLARVLHRGSRDRSVYSPRDKAVRTGRGQLNARVYAMCGLNPLAYGIL